jgi:hypothetical protein
LKKPNYRIEIGSSLLSASETPPSGRCVALSADTLELPDGGTIVLYRLELVENNSDSEALDERWLKSFPYFNPIVSGYDLINQPTACPGYLLRLADSNRSDQLGAYSNDVECTLIPA